MYDNDRTKYPLLNWYYITTTKNSSELQISEVNKSVTDVWNTMTTSQNIVKRL